MVGTSKKMTVVGVMAIAPVNMMGSGSIMLPASMAQISAVPCLMATIGSMSMPTASLWQALIIPGALVFG